MVASVKMPVDFDHDIDAEVAPGQVGWIALAEDLDLLAVHDQGIVGVLDAARERAVGGVALEEQCVQLDRHEVVDGNHFRVRRALDEGLERLAADAAETVDPYSGRHG